MRSKVPLYPNSVFLFSSILGYIVNSCYSYTHFFFSQYFLHSQEEKATKERRQPVEVAPLLGGKGVASAWANRRRAHQNDVRFSNELRRRVVLFCRSQNGICGCCIYYNKESNMFDFVLPFAFLVVYFLFPFHSAYHVAFPFLFPFQFPLSCF